MRLTHILALVLVALLLPAASYAQLFSASVYQDQNTLYWVYALTNNAEPSDTILGFEINWDNLFDENDPPAQALSATVIGRPDDWIEAFWWPWPNWDPNPAPGDPIRPLPGDELSGFIVDSEEPATHFRVTYTYYDDQVGDFVEGTFAGEITAVPEPSSLLAVLGSLGSLSALVRRRRS